MRTDHTIDVLIIGAGPTGLLMAAECARHGLSCRLVDKGVTYEDLSRAVAIQARTLEIFKHIGIVDKFVSEGLPIRAANPMSRNKRIARLLFEDLVSPYPFVLSLEQSKTERILGEHAATLGVKIERQKEFLQFEEKADGIEAILRPLKSGQLEQVTASWLIACDGAHSAVRKQLGLTFEGKFFPDIFSLADVHVHWEYPHNELFAFLNAKGVLAAIPLPEKDRYRLIFQLKRCRKILMEKDPHAHGTLNEQIIPDPTLKEVEDLLSEYVGSHVRVSDPVWMANFYINSRISNAYRVGRIFLAGDAAHIHSPIGGQGMNTGLQDAFNLAWKLAYVQKKKAGDEILRTYDLERHSVGRALLKKTEKASQLATLHSPAAVSCRNFLAGLLMKMPSMRKKIIQGISQIRLLYPRSVLIQESRFSGPKAGLRAPNAPLKPADLYTLMEKTTAFHLLLFAGQQKQDLSHFSKRFASGSVIPILIYYGDLAASEIDGVKTCHDPNGTAHQIYGVKNGGVYVIRPDTYIGYRSHSVKESNIDGYFRFLNPGECHPETVPIKPS